MGEEATSTARNGGHWRPFGAVLVLPLEMVQFGIRCRGSLCKSQGKSATRMQEEARSSTYLINSPTRLSKSSPTRQTVHRPSTLLHQRHPERLGRRPRILKREF